MASLLNGGEGTAGVSVIFSSSQAKRPNKVERLISEPFQFRPTFANKGVGIKSTMFF
jgi:hypothetical protein